MEAAGFVKGVRSSSSMIVRRAASFETSDSEGRHVNFEGKDYILLDYHLEDTFPHLPAFLESDCAVCSMIRERILVYRNERAPECTGLFIYKFALQFETSLGKTPPCLDSFVVCFEMSGGNDRDHIPIALWFRVQAEVDGRFMKSLGTLYCT